MATSKSSISKSAKSTASSRVVARKRSAAIVRGGDSKSAVGAPAGSRAAVRDFIERLRNLTPEEFDASLRTAGIITKSGKLAKPYRG